jgi:hypothetical protein
MEFTKVTKEEFEQFLKLYPNSLNRDITGICEPPLMSYNDFTYGHFWPESMVAKCILNEDMKGHPAYQGEPNDYYINREAPQELKEAQKQQPTNKGQNEMEKK